MKRKIIIFIITITMIISSIPCVVGAASGGGNIAAPNWQNTAVVSCKIGFPDDGYGYAEAHVMGHLDASNIKADVYVYRQEGSDWIYVGEEHKSAAKSSLTISCKFTPIDGAYYRADYTLVVTKNGVDEKIEQTRYKTK